MLSELRIKIIETKELSYSQAAKETGLNKGEIWRAVNKGIYPRAKWKREALGLPCLAEVPVCPIHGEAHTVSCPNQRKKRPRPKSTKWCVDRLLLVLDLVYLREMQPEKAKDYILERVRLVGKPKPHAD